MAGLTAARQKAYAAARQHKSFVSHCAPEPAAAGAAAAAEVVDTKTTAKTARKKRPRKGATVTKAEAGSKVEEGGEEVGEEATGDVDDIGTITLTLTPGAGAGAGPSTPTPAHPPLMESETPAYPPSRPPTKYATETPEVPERRIVPLGRPLGSIVGPAAAAAEKAQAGEGRNVEHVALEDETETGVKSGETEGAGSSAKRARKL